MELLPYSSFTIGMVYLTLSSRQCMSKNIKPLQVCSSVSCLVFSRLKESLQMHIAELESHSFNACSCLSPKGNGCNTNHHCPVLMVSSRHHVRFFPADSR